MAMIKFSIFPPLLKLRRASNFPAFAEAAAGKQFSKLLWFSCILAVFGAAIFFRLWQLDSIPPGLYPDVAINGNDAMRTLKTGDFKIFYPDNNGREGLFMWLISFSFLIFGASVWSIKIVAATIGILTGFGLYLLVKEILSKYAKGSEKYIALLSAYFMAVSFWHVNFSRLGFRAILLPFILVFASYFLLKGFRIGLENPPGGKKLWNFIAAGIIFGLGFYTYISFRLAILLLPIIIIYWFFAYRKKNLFKKFRFYTLCFLVSIFLIALPIGIYFLLNPADFMSRTSGVSIFSQNNPLAAFGESLIKHLAMFNFYGDPNWRHNYSGSPQLFWPVGILFLIGLFVLIKDFIFGWKNQNCFSRAPRNSDEDKNCYKFYFSCFILGWFFIMLLPSVLTIEGIPHALRAIGVVPAVYILAALGGWRIFEFLNKNTERKKMLIAASFLFLLAVGFSEFNKYFISWGQAPKVKEAFTQKYADIGNYLNSLPDDTQKYVIVNQPGSPLYGISIDAQTPMFLEYTSYGRLRTSYLRVEDLNQINIGQKETIIIPLYGWETWVELFNYFPQGKFKIQNGFVVLEIES